MNMPSSSKFSAQTFNTILLVIVLGTMAWVGTSIMSLNKSVASLNATVAVTNSQVMDDRAVIARVPALEVQVANLDGRVTALEQQKK